MAKKVHRFIFLLISFFLIDEFTFAIFERAFTYCSFAAYTQLFFVSAGWISIVLSFFLSVLYSILALGVDSVEFSSIILLIIAGLASFFNKILYINRTWIFCFSIFCLFAYLLIINFVFLYSCEPISWLLAKLFISFGITWEFIGSKKIE